MGCLFYWTAQEKIMTSNEESQMDPFLIGTYAIEVLMVLAVLYAMWVLPSFLLPVS
jgi:hypothetical protein